MRRRSAHDLDVQTIKRTSPPPAPADPLQRIRPRSRIIVVLDRDREPLDDVFVQLGRTRRIVASRTRLSIHVIVGLTDKLFTTSSA
jgi:hypothetical protein